MSEDDIAKEKLDRNQRLLILLALIADLAVEEKRALRTVVDELIALEQAADPPAAE
jgi:hypothetical protein